MIIIKISDRLGILYYQIDILSKMEFQYRIILQLKNNISNKRIIYFMMDLYLFLLFIFIKINYKLILILIKWNY